MLYLAEVQKQKAGLLGGGSKTELKLLACQRTDLSWSTVSEEIITAEEASKFNDGSLLLVEINPNRQVQRIQEAGRPLVNILQNFSRQLEKFKVKEEEIDQWKQSLTFQAQELNRREMDMEVRLEQLQQREDECQHLEAQKHEVETSHAEISRRQEEIERTRKELEGAWEHLRGEQRRVEEYKNQAQQGTVLDQQQIQSLRESIDVISHDVVPTEQVREHLNRAFEIAERQQALLNPHWQQLEQQRTAANQQQVEVDTLAQNLATLQNEWQQSQHSLEQQAAEIKVNTALLNSKQEYTQKLKEDLLVQESIYQQIQSLAVMSCNVILSQPVDIAALEKMPLEELQKIVQDLQIKLDIDFNFVNDQEQELKYKQALIDGLQQKIHQASESERSQLEAELVEEKDLYQMLNKTLVGQRRNLLERQELLKEHQVVLLRRQGYTHGNEQDTQNIAFSPLLVQIEQEQQQRAEELQNLEREIEQIRANIEQAQTVFEAQTQQQEMKRQELQTREEHLRSLRIATGELWGRVNLYQEALQPLQDGLDELRQKLQSIADALTQVQAFGDYHLQAITHIRNILQDLMSQTQLLAS